MKFLGFFYHKNIVKCENSQEVSEMTTLFLLGLLIYHSRQTFLFGDHEISTYTKHI